MAIKSPTTDIALFADLVRVETRLYNHLDAVLRTAHGLVTSQFEFLCWVRDHDGARIVDLAVEFAVGLGAVSKAMDRYERSGWIERRPHPDDRRSAILALTDAGRLLVDAAEETVAEQLGRILSSALSPAERRRTADALGALRDRLEAEQLGRPVG